MSFMERFTMTFNSSCGLRLSSSFFVRMTSSSGKGWGEGRTTALLLVILTALSLTSLTLCSAQKNVFKSHAPTSIVIPHIKYGQGLNRWSFLSVDRDNHGLHSDLLCPNPMVSSPGGVTSSRAGNNRGNSEGGRRQNKNQQQQNSRFPVPAQSSLPNEIWAVKVKTNEAESQLPCSLRQVAGPSPPLGNGLVMTNAATGGGTRHNNGHFIENRILFTNISLVPFNFRGATPCTKYIKLMYDEEEGTNLRCRDIPFDNKYEHKYHIHWPDTTSKRKEYFSVLENLEKFLQNEQTYRRQFYFQVYFTSSNGRSKRCAVQQYELDLSYPAGNARFCNLTQTGGHAELCGEFHCEDLIFPLYNDPQPHKGHGKHHGEREGGETEEDEDDDYEEERDYGDEEGSHEQEVNHRTHPKQTKAIGGTTGSGDTFTSSHVHNDAGNDDSNGISSWTRMLRLDIRLLIFITIVPLVLFGILIFGLELIVYFMCCRKPRGQETEGGDRSQQLLQNSLNVWENVPSREAQRTVSFSPMTTNIYAERKNMMMGGDAASLQDHPETPKILKSALKKPGEHSSPTTAAHHYFEYDHDMPPSYIETTSR